jgi:hypothetical protein
MKHTRWVVVLPFTALLCIAGLLAWVRAHSGYPNTIYYERLTITNTSVPGSAEYAELWVDPRRNLELRVTGDGPYRYSTLIDRNGQYVRSFRTGMLFEEERLPDDVARSLIRDWQYLEQGGFRALAESRLAHATGPIAHVQFAGHAALRFETTQHDRDTQRLIVWIDARTHDPLQLEVVSTDYDYTQRVQQMRRFDPGSLPAGFFQPPHAHTSYWDQALNWLRDKTGLQH